MTKAGKTKATLEERDRGGRLGLSDSLRPIWKPGAGGEVRGAQFSDV